MAQKTVLIEPVEEGVHGVLVAGLVVSNKDTVPLRLMNVSEE